MFPTPDLLDWRIPIYIYIYIYIYKNCRKKTVEVEFKIKPWHPISRGNMSVDQPFLICCSRRSSYFSNFHWCAQSMLASKGSVNSAMITFFKLTDQMTRSGCWQVDVISVGKASCRFTPAINIVKLATVVEGYPKASFSVATTPRWKGGRYSFPWIAPLYPRYVPYIAEC